MSYADVLRTRPTVVRYAVPIVGLGLATAVSLIIRYTVGQNPAITIAYLVAVLASAWWGGYIPGLIACLLGMFVVPYVFNPHYNIAAVPPVRTALVLAVSLLISHVANRRDRAEDALRVANETLDEKVRQRTAELERSNAELRRLNDDLNQFAYSASHDLQEPLRMIMIFSQMLERKYRGQLNSEADRYIANVVQGAKRMEALLQDLLAYSRLINTAPDSPGEADCNAAVLLALSNLSAAVNESGAAVIYDGLPVLRIQQVHLLQLFQNLIGNAIKYRGKDAPRIEIKAELHGSEWKICVKDNGIGIAPRYTHQIFGMFKRLHSTEEYAGTGMGLAICQRIVQRYGGRIWVDDSQPGQGSTFCFALPSARGASKAANV